MKILKLKLQDASPRILSFLEKEKLIRTLRASRKIVACRKKDGAMEVIYRSSPAWGTHKLICVKKNSPEIELNYHPDNEEFIIINNHPGPFRPLILVIGLLKKDELAARFRSGEAGADDFIALRFSRNDCRTGVFTMLKGTVHCEIVPPGRGQGPIFFVAEPAGLKLYKFRTNGYKLVC